jgi:hypothetical protein
MVPLDSHSRIRSGLGRIISQVLFGAAIALALWSAWRATQGPRTGIRSPKPSEYALAWAFAGSALWGLRTWFSRLRRREADVPSDAGILRFGFYLFTLHWAWVQWLHAVPGRHALEVSLGIPAALLCAGIALAPRLLPRQPRRLLRLLDVLLFNICLTPLAIEVGLRLLSLGSDSLVLESPQPSMEKRMRQLRLEPGQIVFGFPCDERGSHDEPPRQRGRLERLVVLIGDSFGVGIVPHLYHYTTEAERHLPWAQIYSLSINAVDVPEYRRLLTSEALALDPDLLLIGVFVGNDIIASQHRSLGPPSLFNLVSPLYERRGVMLHLVPQRLSRLTHERAELGRVGIDLGEQGERLQHSAESLRLAEPYLFDPLREPPSFTKELFAQIESARVLEVCTTGPKAEDNYAFFFREFERLLRAAGGRRVAVVLIPDEFQIEDSLWENTVTGWSVPLKRFQPQERLVPWFAERGVPCLDLLPILRAEPTETDGDRHLYHLRDTHFNVRGNRRVGEALAEFLTFLAPETQVARIEGAPEPTLLGRPGLPEAPPLRCFAPDGLELPLASLWPRARLVSSAPAVVQVTPSGQLVALRRGSATIELEVDGLRGACEVRAFWPPLVELGGGSPTGSRGELRALGERFPLGHAVRFSLTGLDPGASGNLCVSVRPALGWVLDRDPTPHDPGPLTLISIQADEMGTAQFDFQLPGAESWRGRPLFFTVRWGDRQGHPPYRFTPVLAITPG